ncbi:DUF692 domain-containing protein [Sphingomonas daechungensis]|uniref:DUF692 domain-containing protein n=1 Tax=Sphingomonas daechungensis TaxID=1176646 RepID=A0ABX6T0P3_9SPHN|nr:DUF692 domain-containing protein [Sphingomonas daechungensis]QNP43416.1 DUF692 domain-containing protein [Sphingomonas daechungensis]
MIPTAGLGFKPQHFSEALASPAVGLWFEVHAENYMVEGGPRLAMLEQLRRDRRISLHGVGMSLGSPSAPDPNHLDALKSLVDRFEPALVSEHLAWSRFDGRSFPDLLPLPRTNETLACLSANIGRVQDALGREILIENPTHYLPLNQHRWSETSFLRELARRSGCKLLVDINNVAVGANNIGFDPAAWLLDIPAKLIGEIHLAGHSLDAEGALLIDSHDQPISEDVWALYEGLIARTGPRPTLIERDGNVPAFAELIHERDRAQAILDGGLRLAA